MEPKYRGKVRDIYDLGENLLLVTSDRVSAYDVVLPQVIPDKGCILTAISKFWFDLLEDQFPNHVVSTDAADLPEPYRSAAADWGPRFMLVKKLEMLPVECVARGYLAGSGWKEYQAGGTVCGIGLPTGLVECSELEHPIFTPATKAQEGHDINISSQEAGDIIGHDLIQELERRTLEIYGYGRRYARERGVILADTKFEFGMIEGEPVPILADEVLTPDSSRYWPADEYRPGQGQPSFDKQYVRDFLTSTGWKGDPPAPDLPADVIAGTVSRYEEIYQRLTGNAWSRRSNK